MQSDSPAPRFPSQFLVLRETRRLRDGQGHRPAERLGPRRGALPAGEQQMGGPDDHGRERLDVDLRRQAAEVALEAPV